MLYKNQNKIIFNYVERTSFQASWQSRKSWLPVQSTVSSRSNSDRVSRHPKASIEKFMMKRCFQILIVYKNLVARERYEIRSTARIENRHKHTVRSNQQEPAQNHRRDIALMCSMGVVIVVLMEETARMMRCAAAA